MVPVSMFCSEGGIFTHGADSNLAVSHSCHSKEMVFFKKHFFPTKTITLQKPEQCQDLLQRIFPTP